MKPDNSGAAAAFGVTPLSTATGVPSLPTRNVRGGTAKISETDVQDF
jgi:hypothetical protein